ncbi:MBL fold metallo-hydrolase [Oceanibacterium hippocampi]|uniref:Beta-lactamase hydrolase-like protein n=1 Tax=Oceanibacterium hippocampi TaxID=745714 RepID=A0A1Y5RVZ1_9PROT|nr:rhodanese-like domain-containing protein [Oceanibacterium hippocampi]SLN25417.1 Beta-lactamase hydrolase-like protein [Oceanibacterium hippocampi]
MFIEKVKSDGLAHLSYLLGDGGVAAVIDPRRDCEIYVEKARALGCRITRVFETHRNEDLVSGAPILARLTGATVHHGPNPDGAVRYAETVREGDDFTFGKLRLKVVETPGHTDDSLSFAVFDTDFGDQPVGVFTGDALFVGDVGRTDFYPDRAEEVAGLLFDSLRKITALGDQAIVYPAHGAGSVCGDNMADREFSTIGYERQSNPMLRIADRETFVARKVAEHHDQPPYFRRMERLNLEGGTAMNRVVTPPSLDLATFVECSGKAVTIDVRGVAAFLGAHFPDSLAIPDDMVPAFAGWLLDPEQDLMLVATDAAQAETAARHLARIGYDRVTGFLAAAPTGWAANGRPFRSVAAVDVGEVARRVADGPDGWTLLDVRDDAEFDADSVEGARHVYVGKLPTELDGLEKDRHYTVMCASGARATIAASVLLRAGFTKVDVFLGSMGAWRSAGYQTT